MVILNIDTAIDKGSVCISNKDKIIAYTENENRNEQASWLLPAIESTLKTAGLDMSVINAISVSNGPGSYTGLRIGLATAKGLCYAKQIPLICLSTLEIMANAVKQKADDLICPMIDARRMEVFTAVYDNGLSLLKEPFSIILNESSFSDLLGEHSILFTGNGSQKFASIIGSQSQAAFLDKTIDARDMIPLSITSYEQKMFSDVAYCNPFYVKDVYITA